MAWAIKGVSTVAESANGNLTLNAPGGTPAIGDLLIACIGMRSNLAFTAPAGEGWTLIDTQQLSGDTDATSGIASGGMWYKVLTTAADPSFAFTRSAGVAVAQGACVRYSGVDTAAPLTVGSASTLGAVGEPSHASINCNAGDLIVAMISHGDTTICSTFDAVTDPATASNGTDTTTNPTTGTWIERFDVSTGTGADHGLTIGDAVKTTTGATGTISANAVTTSRSVFIVAAFKQGAATNIVLNVICNA